MRESTVRSLGLALAAAYAVFIVWLYVRQPQTVAEMTGAMSASIGAYRIDDTAFADGLRLFRGNQFEAARLAFDRADRAHQDPRTQFYVAYSYYRQGWGRVYNDDALFQRGLEAVDRAIAAAPNGRIVVDDPDLQMRSADELKAELQAGMRREASDLNPLKVFRQRK
jgi:tetratricopeptide (TPR) repeat protein